MTQNYIKKYRLKDKKTYINISKTCQIIKTVKYILSDVEMTQC